MITARTEEWGRIVYDQETDEFHAHILDDAADVRVSRPISVGCLLTGKCNLNCAFCYGNDESLPDKEIGAGDWARIFRHLGSWGVMRVDLSGGEPTMRKDLADIAESAVQADLNVILSTNGLVLKKLADLDRFPAIRWHVSMDSGLPDVHQNSRILRTLRPSTGSFKKTTDFILHCLDTNRKVRVLTSLGAHNMHQLFALGEHLALIGVREWNLSKILRAGRAQREYDRLWHLDEQYVLEQIHHLRSAFPFIRIRYSNRADQNGYFLLVLPDGSLATQHTDGRDKVILGNTLGMPLADLQSHPEFALKEHARKWIAARLGWQPCYPDIALGSRVPRESFLNVAIS